MNFAIITGILLSFDCITGCDVSKGSAMNIFIPNSSIIIKMLFKTHKTAQGTWEMAHWKFLPYKRKGLGSDVQTRKKLAVAVAIPITFSTGGRRQVEPESLISSL